jgi:hypothetical protein
MGISSLKAKCGQRKDDEARHPPENGNAVGDGLRTGLRLAALNHCACEFAGKQERARGSQIM